jgi:Raf kinase inhibitor-like YbhB/YbcL family protein
MELRSNSFDHNGPIRGENAFCVQAEQGHVGLAPNKSPHVAWGGVPEGTRSFAIVCHDPDVPSVGDDVNQEDRVVPAGLSRVDFYHWVLVDISRETTELREGADSDGVVAGGKKAGPTKNGVRGINNYTDWFSGDAEMGGDYGGFDGPCPPWNDELLHHYHFTVYALDIDSLGLEGRFGGTEALAAMEGHVLDKATIVGTYTLNPTVDW